MRLFVPTAALLCLLGLAACSSSFGVGGDPPPAKVVVAPQPQ